MISPHFHSFWYSVSWKQFTDIFSHYWWVRLNSFQCPSPERKPNSVTNYTTGRHILHTTPRKMIVISRYYVQLWVLSILVYRHMGTLGKCQTEPSEFITMDHYMTGGRHLCLHVHTLAVCKQQHHPQPFIDSLKMH